MDLLVAIDHRFEQTPDGAVWSWFFDQAFWTRYLDVFERVRVLGRAKPVETPAAIARRSDGPRVSFVPLPFYRGPAQYLAQVRAIRQALCAALRPAGAVILRGGQISNSLAKTLAAAGRPYGLEVVGDPYDVFAPGTGSGVLRPFFRWWYPRQLRRLCRESRAVAYVTETALQERYPPAPGAFATHYSSIDLPADALAATSRSVVAPCRNLLAVGTMDQLYKGQHVLLDAFARTVREGADLTLALAGDGRNRPRLEEQARKYGLGGRVRFLGALRPGAAVREQMDRADLFVLPSLQEGLPRALIEAMARGLPCLATTVGGTPELLPGEDRVPAGDPSAMARKILEVHADVPRLNRMADRNLRRSRLYLADELRIRRIEFYRRVEAATMEWQNAGTATGGAACAS